MSSNLTGTAYTAELDGEAQIVVFDDADLESAVNDGTFASFVVSDQTCVGDAHHRSVGTLRRVHEEIPGEGWAYLKEDEGSYAAFSTGSRLNILTLLRPFLCSGKPYLGDNKYEWGSQVAENLHSQFHNERQRS